jgi:uncharacterized protein YbaR (Trm112 family)
LEPAVLSLLACPACLADLQIADLQFEDGRLFYGLVCAGCGRAYPVIEGIPVLIAERAESAPLPG